MLKVTPEALEAFERSYQLCVPNGMIKAVKEDWIPRISENYWPSERDQRGIMKDLILIIVSILWCIPILISFVISGLRKKLESDRNFYGKEISPKDIELTLI